MFTVYFLSMESFAKPSYFLDININSCVKNAKSNDVTLNLQHCNLEDKDIPDLIKKMHELKYDGYVNLYDNHITSKGAILLAQYQYRHSYNLRKNNIGPEGLMTFLNDRKLEYLAINENPIDSDTINKFIKGMTIQGLSISNCTLDNEALYAVTNNKNLKEFEISNSPIGDQGVAILAKSLSIHRLELDNANISDYALSAFASNPTLQSLILENNNLTDEGAKILAQNKHLYALGLSNNKISEIGFSALIANPSIEYLHLDNNMIKDSDLEFKNNDTLRLLILSNNKIADKIVNSITVHLHGLNYIDYSKNEITDAGASKLAALNGRDFFEINLSYNQITDIGVIALTKIKSDWIGDLILSHNHITDVGAIALANADDKFGVVKLDISYNKLTARGIDALAKGKHWYFEINTEGERFAMKCLPISRQEFM
jgi:Leucine-rich repeat (LRR) protein